MILSPLAGAAGYGRERAPDSVGGCRSLGLQRDLGGGSVFWEGSILLVFVVLFLF